MLANCRGSWGILFYILCKLLWKKTSHKIFFLQKWLVECWLQWILLSVSMTLKKRLKIHSSNDWLLECRLSFAGCDWSCKTLFCIPCKFNTLKKHLKIHFTVEKLLCGWIHIIICRLRWIVENSEPTIGGRQVFIIIIIMIIFTIINYQRHVILMMMLVENSA